MRTTREDVAAKEAMSALVEGMEDRSDKSPKGNGKHPGGKGGDSDSLDASRQPSTRVSSCGEDAEKEEAEPRACCTSARPSSPVAPVTTTSRAEHHRHADAARKSSAKEEMFILAELGSSLRVFFDLIEKNSMKVLGPD